MSKTIHFTSGLPRACSTRKADLFYVYTLSDSRDSNVFYVGKGKRSRCTAHLRNAINGGKRGSYHVHNKIRKILSEGGDIKIDKVFFSEDQDSAYSEEMRLIQEIGLDNLTNSTLGGNGGYGHRMTEENKEILRGLAKRPKSLEHKRKLSEYRKAHPATPEMLAKTHASNKGRTHDEDWRKRQSEGLRGKPKSVTHRQNLRKPKSAEHVEKMRVNTSKATRCRETGEVFSSRKEAGIKHGVTPEAICQAIRLNRKSNGLHWDNVV